MRTDPGGSSKKLKRRATARVLENDNESRAAGLHSLERQGHMMRACSTESVSIWAKVVQALPPDQLRFILNATVDTLPHNSNLYLWKKKPQATCPLCGEQQTLIHVLNCCHVARDLRRYNQRHDAALKIVANAVDQHLSLPNASLSVDLGDNYSFPTHIVPTDLRPDIVWWDDLKRVIVMVELTIPFDTVMEGARERKEAKYDHLRANAVSKGYRASLITLEIGSRGVPNMPGFEALAKKLHLSSSSLRKLLTDLIKTTIEGSFLVWVQRIKLN